MNKKYWKFLMGLLIISAFLILGTKFLPPVGYKTVGAETRNPTTIVDNIKILNAPVPTANTPFSGFASTTTENVPAGSTYNFSCINTESNAVLRKGAIASYNTVYKLTFSCTIDNADYSFADQDAFTATFNGNSAFVESVTSKKVSVSYTLPPTAKAKLLSVTPPAAVSGVKNGAPKTADGLRLPRQVSVQTEDSSVNSSAVSWNVSSVPTSGSNSYNPDNPEEQSFTVTGEVTCPANIDPAGKTSVSVRVTVAAAAEAADAPDTDAEPGGFAGSKTIHLSSQTPGAVIYYTTDGSIPDRDSTQYNGPITIDTTTTIKAIAAARGYQNSAVSEFTFNKLKAIASLTITAKAPVAAGLPSPVSVAEANTLKSWSASYYHKGDDILQQNAAPFGYYKTYYLSFSAFPDSTSAFTENLTATVNGQNAHVARQSNGSIVVTYTYAPTAKATLQSYVKPGPITGLKNGAPKTADGLSLPKQVSIQTEDPSSKYADVSWSLDKVPVSGKNSYDPQNKEAQTFTVEGTIICPEGVDDGGIELGFTVTVTVNAKSESSTPPSSGQSGQGEDVDMIPSETKGEDVETIPAEIREEDKDSKTLAVKVVSTLKEGKVIADVTLPVEQIRSMAKGGTEEKAVEISILLDSKKVQSALTDSKIKAVELNLSLDLEMMEKEHLELTEVLLGGELLKSAQAEGKALTLSVRDEDKALLYRWSIDSAGLAGTKSLNLAVNTDKREDGMNILLYETANLPSGALLQMNTEAGAQTEPGQKVYLYHYNESSKKLESLPRVIYTVDGNGCISVPVKISGHYVLLTEKPRPAERISLLKQVKVRRSLTVKPGNQSSITVSIPDTVKQLSSFSAENLGRIAPSEKAAIIRYESLNPGIASVNRKTGVVTAKKKGKAVIRARITIRGGGTKLHRITVAVK